MTPRLRPPLPRGQARQAVALPTTIVGTVFRGPEARTACALMRPGDVVLLQREPANPHDRFAIACYYLGRHVGYLPRQVDPRVAEALDFGIAVTCTVREPPVVEPAPAKAGGPRIRAEPKLTVEWEEA